MAMRKVRVLLYARIATGVVSACLLWLFGIEVSAGRNTNLSQPRASVLEPRNTEARHLLHGRIVNHRFGTRVAVA